VEWNLGTKEPSRPSFTFGTRSQPGYCMASRLHVVTAMCLESLKLGLNLLCTVCTVCTLKCQGKGALLRQEILSEFRKEGGGDRIEG
jgi:hypothetical protein